MKPWITVAISVALGVAACSQPVSPPADPVATVRTAPVSTRSLDETVTAYGQVEFDPAAVRTLTATFEAQVGQIHVAVGEAVSAGQPIVSLIASPTTALDLDRLTRDAAVAAAEQARLQRLRTDGLASDAEVATATAAAATARQASANLRRLTGGGRITLTAPAAGVVDSLPASPGALVAAGGPVAGLGSTRQMNARLGLEVEDAQRLEPGAPIRLTGLHESGSLVETRVASIDRRVDPTTRLAAALVALPPGSPVLPGEALKGEIVLATRADALVVPRAAVLYEGDQPLVFVIDRAGVARRRPVTIGLDQGDVIQIIAGVTVNDRVVVEGGAALSDRMKTREAAAAPGATAPAQSPAP